VTYNHALLLAWWKHVVPALGCCLVSGSLNVWLMDICVGLDGYCFIGVGVGQQCESGRA
jgi:hypothetical protein